MKRKDESGGWGLVVLARLVSVLISPAGHGDSSLLPCSVWEEKKRREGERRLEEEKRGKPFHSPARDGEDI